MNDSKPPPDNAASPASSRIKVKVERSGARNASGKADTADRGEDAIVNALQLAAGLFDIRVEKADLLTGTGIAPPATIADVPVLAERAGLLCEQVEKSLQELAYVGSPALLVGKDGNATLAARWLDGDRVILAAPGGGKGTIVSRLSAVASNYSGRAIVLRPAFHFDRRTGSTVEDEGTRDWFWGTILEFRRYFLDIALAALLINVFGLATAIFAMQVYDRVVPNEALETLWILSLGVFIVAGFDFAMRTLRGRYIDMAGSRADLIVSRRLFERLLGMRLGSKPASAGAMAMTMREFETIREFFTSATVSVLVDFPFVLIFIAVIGFIGGWLAVVPAAAIPIILLVGYFIQRRLGKAIQKSLRQKAHRGSILVESVTGLEVIKGRTAEGQMLRTWNSVNEAGAATSDDIRRYSAYAINFASFAYMIVFVFMIIWGVYQISDGLMTLGALIACSILLGRAMAPVAGMAALLVRLAQSREALEKLDDLMQTPVDRPLGTVFHRPERFRGEIEFRGVDFAYTPETRKVIERLSVTIPAGEKVGVIGSIGCGKSTFARLMLGLYEPSSGSVLCDGLDIRQLDPAYYRAKIGYVEQSPFLFFGTIRENIAMGHPGVDASALMQAAETAGVLDFVGETSQGLELVVSERGENLSGGQRQSICLARALLLNPPILILDEPTSAMDPMSEEKFKQRLARIAADRTVVILTHRASLLSLVDRLLVLDGGRLVAEGPREAVLAALKDGRISRGGQVRQTP